MSAARPDGPTVLVTGNDVTEPELAQMRAAAPSADVRFFETQEELEANVDGAEVVAGWRLSPAALARAGKLRWIHTWAAGPDSLLHPEMKASPVVATSSKGNGAIPLAEFAIMAMLNLSRDVRRALRAQDEHRWDFYKHQELNGRTVGIIGLGNAGQDLALKCKAFHMRVLGMRRLDQPTPNVDELFPRERLREMLAQCDYVVVAAPRTPETTGMLGEAEFRAMKPTAFYVCFSRGGIADEAALLRALNEGWIAGAALDAHAHEPLAPDSPFWTAPNSFVTAHNAASSFLTRERGVGIFVENLRRYVAGQPLLNVVDKQLGY